jgi:hypothetical protein
MLTAFRRILKETGYETGRLAKVVEVRVQWRSLVLALRNPFSVCLERNFAQDRVHPRLSQFIIHKIVA